MAGAQKGILIIYSVAGWSKRFFQLVRNFLCAVCILYGGTSALTAQPIFAISLGKQQPDGCSCGIFETNYEQYLYNHVRSKGVKGSTQNDFEAFFSSDQSTYTESEIARWRQSFLGIMHRVMIKIPNSDHGDDGDDDDDDNDIMDCYREPRGGDSVLNKWEADAYKRLLPGITSSFKKKMGASSGNASIVDEKGIGSPRLRRGKRDRQSPRVSDGKGEAAAEEKPGKGPSTRDNAAQYPRKENKVVDEEGIARRRRDKRDTSRSPSKRVRPSRVSASPEHGEKRGDGKGEENPVKDDNEGEAFEKEMQEVEANKEEEEPGNAPSSQVRDHAQQEMFAY